MIIPSKKRRKELREIYEDKIGREFVKGLEKEPICSSFEWVDLIVEYGNNKPT